MNSSKIPRRQMLAMSLAALPALALRSQPAMTAEPNPPKIFRAKFQLFDAMNYPGKPDLSQRGFKPAHLVYETSLFGNDKAPTATPSDLALKRVADAAPSWPGLLIIDVERWIGLPDETDRYVQLIDRLKTLIPDRPIGYYSVVPVRDYWRAREKHTDAKFIAWHAENDAFQKVANGVGALYPSLYTFYDYQPGWVVYAEENLREARRLARGKPVYAFLWPTYHESNAQLRGQAVPGDYWRLQLETVVQFADGAVIWGGGRPWDEDAPWWRETLAFQQRQADGQK